MREIEASSRVPGKESISWSTGPREQVPLRFGETNTHTNTYAFSLFPSIELLVMAPSSNQRYSLVVYGATGLMGRFVVNHIVQEMHSFRTALPEGFTWAVAGRNSSTLNKLKADLQVKLSPVEIPDVVVANVSDRLGLQKMAEGSKCESFGPHR